MSPQSKHADQEVNHRKAKIKMTPKRYNRPYSKNSVMCHDAVLKALYTPLEQAGIALVPTIVEVVEDGRTFLSMTISFVNIANFHEKIITHYIGHSAGREDTLTLILEF